MDWQELQVYQDDIPFVVLNQIRNGGATIACDIETGGPDRPSLLNWHMGHIATFTLYAPRSNVLAMVRLKEGQGPGWLPALMWDRTVRKIFHYAPFDLSFITHHWQIRAENVVCTKLAARLAGYPLAEQGLFGLSHKLLGVTLDKRQALTDWHAEQLSDEQLQYAAQDVLYLPALYERLMVDVARRNLLAEYELACKWIPARAWLQTHGHRPDRLFDYDYGE